jgi:hypothetical protein
VAAIAKASCGESRGTRVDFDVMMCLICGGLTRRCFIHGGYWIRACEGCGHREAEIENVANHISTVYGDDYFNGGGAGYRDYLSEADILVAQGRRYARLMGRYTNPGTVLDIGSAAGFVLKGFTDGGWSGQGIEPNAWMAHYASTQLGLDVVTGSLEDVRIDRTFDLVSMIQIVAHFINPRAALKVADSVTRSGGFWLFETWNRASITARLFGRHWHEYSPPSVLHWFAPKELCRLASEFGFREVARGRPLKRIKAAHAQSLVKYRSQDSRLGRALGNLIGLLPAQLSLPYPAEDLLWIILQKD